MRSKEEILEQMRDAMPFGMSESVDPYILGVMEIYAKEKACA